MVALICVAFMCQYEQPHVQTCSLFHLLAHRYSGWYRLSLGVCVTGNVALPLLSFQPASLEDVTTLIQNGKTKSSKIYPMPTALLKANTSVFFAPIFVDLLNLSYKDCKSGKLKALSLTHY